MVREVKKVLAYWLTHLYKDCTPETQRYFCNLILNKIVEDNENTLEYCLLLYEIARGNPKSLDYLI